MNKSKKSNRQSSRNIRRKSLKRKTMKRRNNRKTMKRKNNRKKSLKRKNNRKTYKRKNLKRRSQRGGGSAEDLRRRVKDKLEQAESMDEGLGSYYIRLDEYLEKIPDDIYIKSGVNYLGSEPKTFDEGYLQAKYQLEKTGDYRNVLNILEKTKRLAIPDPENGEQLEELEEIESAIRFLSEVLEEEEMGKSDASPVSVKDRVKKINEIERKNKTAAMRERLGLPPDPKI